MNHFVGSGIPVTKHLLLSDCWGADQIQRTDPARLSPVSRSVYDDAGTAGFLTNQEYVPGTQMTFIFEGLFQSKQGPNSNQNKGHGWVPGS